MAVIRTARRDLSGCWGFLVDGSGKTFACDWNGLGNILALIWTVRVVILACVLDGTVWR